MDDGDELCVMRACLDKKQQKRIHTMQLYLMCNDVQNDDDDVKKCNNNNK